MVRIRQFLVRKRTDVKNRIHSILDGELFHLSQILTDIFGMSGQHIMQGILKGISADEILTLIHSRIRAKSETKIRALLTQELSPSALMQLDLCLKIIKVYDEQIKEITKVARSYVLKNHLREYKIIRSVPGVGDIGAIILIAEIGNFKDFDSGDKLASWLGLVPKVYQSANHTIKRSITKRGSGLARWIMTQIAHAVTRCQESVLKNWYEAKKNMIGTGKAIIGLARKMITIIWHLVVNDELYVEKDSEGKEKEPKKVHTIRIPASPTYTLEQIVAIISDAITTLNKQDPDPS
jgi:transposase